MKNSKIFIFLRILRPRPCAFLSRAFSVEYLLLPSAHEFCRCRPPSRRTVIKRYTLPRVSAFSFCLKKKTPAKEKQTRGFTPRPPQRRAAVHSSRLSVGSSAHSHANAPELERVRARASCFASRSLACLNWLIKHCGAAIGSLIMIIN